MWLLSALSQSTSVSRDLPQYVINWYTYTYVYMTESMQHNSLCYKQQKHIYSLLAL